MNASPPLLQMRGISKSFPGVRALDEVNLELRAGEVHALMGENGAGKSTLIKVLTGVYTPDSGSIAIDGHTVCPRSPAQAGQMGIGAIHQEVDLLPYLSVAENIFIGRQPMSPGRINWRELNARARTAMSRLGISIDVTAPLGTYPVAIRQMTAIARAVDQSCRLLVMDEPTSSLDETEVKQLFQAIERLKSQGVGIIFISHFLEQVYEISDRITVLRNGEEVGVFETSSLPRLDLIGHMLGRNPADVQKLVEQKHSSAASADAPILLEARRLGRKRSIKPLDMEVRAGEVLGIAGLLGSGRTELARLLFGIDRKDSGTVSISGKVLGRLSPREAMHHGVAYSPEDRRSEGIIPDLSVRENIVLAIHKRISRFGLVSRRKQDEIARRFIDSLGIVTPSPEQPVKNLSGGNQQKVILARWLAAEPKLLILDEPTRGIDVGAKAEVEALIESLSAAGMAVLFISSELEEVLRRSHRVVVLRDRQKVAELAGSEITEIAVMKAIAGGSPDASA